MGNWQRLSTAKQLADHLREELRRGRWQGTMPGVIKLAGDLGVSRDSLEVALMDLEREGLLRSQGRGKRRQIVAEHENGDSRPLRVAFILYETVDTKFSYILELRHQLIEAGHQVLIAPRSLTELQLNVERVAKMVGRIEADAWLVLCGSREVLEWFAAQPVPALALFGRQQAVPIAGVGPDHLPALITATRRLIELGHRRIVQLTRPERRIPGPGALERAVLDEIASHGIPVGQYNLPNWKDNREGLHECLHQLFRHTPPTALFIDEACLFFAAQLQLARMGIHAPQHVSLVCCEPDTAFDWIEPPISHIRWDPRLMIRHVVRWVAGVAGGRNARRKMWSKAEFVEGGTIGPVAGGRT